KSPDDLVITQGAVSYYYVEQFRAQHSLLAGAAAFQNAVPFNVSFGDEGSGGSGKPQRIFGHLVSPDYFALIGIQPQAGRVFSPEMDKAGDAPAVVISDRFWKRRMNSSPEAVGRRIRLNGQLATIVGIAPPGFNGALPMTPAELFVP